MRLEYEEKMKSKLDDSSISDEAYLTEAGTHSVDTPREVVDADDTSRAESEVTVSEQRLMSAFCVPTYLHTELQQIFSLDVLDVSTLPVPLPVSQSCVAVIENQVKLGRSAMLEKAEQVIREASKQKLQKQLQQLDQSLQIKLAEVTDDDKLTDVEKNQKMKVLRSNHADNAEKLKYNVSSELNRQVTVINEKLLHSEVQAFDKQSTTVERMVYAVVRESRDAAQKLQGQLVVRCEQELADTLNKEEKVLEDKERLVGEDQEGLKNELIEEHQQRMAAIKTEITAKYDQWLAQVDDSITSLSSAINYVPPQGERTQQLDVKADEQFTNIIATVIRALNVLGEFKMNIQKQMLLWEKEDALKSAEETRRSAVVEHDRLTQERWLTIEQQIRQDAEAMR